MPAGDSGPWSLSCWHRECFLPTAHCQLLLLAASHGLPFWVLAPASPRWVQLSAWQADVPSWMSPELTSLAVPGCFPALRQQLLEPGSAGCKLGHSSPEWFCSLAQCLLSHDYLEKKAQTDSSALRLVQQSVVSQTWPASSGQTECPPSVPSQHLLQKFVLLRNDGPLKYMHEKDKK